MLSKLDSLLNQAAILLSDQQKRQLLLYVRLLDKWNKAYNLTSVRDPGQMLIRHIMDSIVVNPHLLGQRFIDVGTGAGLPGIPLAIVRPDSRFTLLDSLGKRIRFLRQAQHELQLTNIDIIQSRVEEHIPSVPYDGIVSRAFASVNDMLLWCKNLAVADENRYYALKGAVPELELAALPPGVRLEAVIKLSVPALDEERHLVVLQPC